MAITLSGNELTDSTRTLAQQGDGLPLYSGTGIWEATTNLLPNGGFETDTTAWSALATATLARVPTLAKFGNASCLVAAAANGDGIESDSVVTTVSQTHTASAWVYIASGGSVQLYLSERTAADALVGTTTGSVSVLTPGVWTRVSVSRTFGGTGAKARVGLVANGDSVFYVDGVQLEQQPSPIPYVETNGISASSSAARVQLSSGEIDAAAAWVAFRVRYGFDSKTAGPASSLYLLDWRDDANNYITVYLATFDYPGTVSTPDWNFYLKRSKTGPTTGTTSYKVQAFSVGDEVTVVAAWTATTITISVDGGTYHRVTGTVSAPTLAAALLDVGSQAGTLQWNGEIVWFAGGLTALTQADHTLLGSFANTPPTASAAPGYGQTVW